MARLRNRILTNSATKPGTSHAPPRRRLPRRSAARFDGARAETKVAYTTIHVHNMHCADCAKQIARKLYALPGVVEVRADVPKNIAYVVPQKDKSLAPPADVGSRRIRAASPSPAWKARRAPTPPSRAKWGRHSACRD